MPPPAFPNFSPPFFVVEIVSALGAAKYTWREVYDAGAGTLAEKVGSGRSGSAENPGVDVLLATFATGDFALCRSAEGRAGLVWELFPVSGSGGSTDCTGDAWLTAVTEDDCYTASVDGGEAIPTDEPLVINEVEYEVDFDPSVPSLSLIPPTGSSPTVDGVKDCGACPCVTFAFPRASFYPDEDVPASVCDRLLRVKICQAACPGPIDGGAACADAVLLEIGTTYEFLGLGNEFFTINTVPGTTYKLVAVSGDANFFVRDYSDCSGICTTSGPPCYWWDGGVGAPSYPACVDHVATNNHMLFSLGGAPFIPFRFRIETGAC